jgi:transcriptional regulator with XRE-family HTH domain
VVTALSLSASTSEHRREPFNSDEIVGGFTPTNCASLAWVVPVRSSQSCNEVNGRPAVRDFDMADSVSDSRTSVKPEFASTFPSVFTLSAPMGIEQRALARIQEDLRQKRYRASQIAERTGRSPSTISEIVNGKAGLSYEVIEAAAAIKGVDPAEFVAHEDAEVRVLQPLEAEFLRYAREWPKAVLVAILDFLRHFAGLGAAEEQHRNAITYLRRMKRPERSRALAYLLLLSEGQLPEDYRAKLDADRPTIPGGSIDDVLVGVPAEDVGPVRAMAKKARMANQKKRRHGG